MSKRDASLYISDALESYLKDISFEAFIADRKTYSATLREYIIIGEAVSKAIDVLSEKMPDFPWRAVKDFRNMIVHENFGVDGQVVWDLSTLELPELKQRLSDIEKMMRL